MKNSVRLMGAAALFVVATLLWTIGQPNEATQQARQERLARLHPTPAATPKPHKTKPQRRHGKHRMANYIVTGAGSPEWDGTYSLVGTETGQPRYELGGADVDHKLFFSGTAYSLTSDSAGGSGSAYINDTPGTDPAGTYSPGLGGAPGPTVTLDSGSPPGAPKAPSVITNLDYSGGVATQFTTAESPLPALADSLSLYALNSEDETVDITLWDLIQDEVAALEDVTFEFPENAYRQLMWVAVNGTGQTEGPRILLWTGSGLSGNNAITPPPPDISNVTAHAFDVPSPGSVSLFIVTPSSATDSDYWTDPASPNIYRSAYLFPLWSPGDSRTLPDSLTSPSAPLVPGTDYKARWQNDPGGANLQVFGPVVSFTTAPAATTPPPPVITGYDDSSPDTATVTAPAMLPGDLVELRYWQRAVPGAYAELATGITSGGTVALTGLVTGQPYQGFWRGYNADGDYADGPATPFTPGGIISTGAPDPPDEVDDTDVTDVSITIEMPAALPLRADAMRLLFKLRSDPDSAYVIAPGGDNLAGGAVVIVEGLTLSTTYRFKPQAFNAFGVTDGPVHDTRTEAVPTVDTVPAAPAAPTLQAKTATSATIKQPAAWPATTTELRLYRRLASGTDGDLVLVHTFATSTEIAYLDTPLTAQQVYVYKCRAHNSVGDSALSPALTVSLVGSGTVTWDNPAEDDSVFGIIRLVVRSASPGVRIEYLGTPLTGLTTNPADTQQRWKDFDTRLLEWQGEIIFVAFAVDANGLDSPGVPLHLLVNNSLFNDVRWGDIAISAAVTETIQTVLAVAEIDPLPALADPAVGRYFEFGVLSPSPVSPLPSNPDSTDLLLLEAMWTQFTKIRLGRDVALAGSRQDDGSFVNQNNTCTLRICSRPREMLTEFAIDTAAVQKMRLPSADTLWIYALPKIYQLDKDGFAVLHDLDALGFTAPDYVFVDAVNMGNLVHAALDDGRLLVVDTVTPDRSFFETPTSQTRPLVFVERLGTDVYRIYTDGTGANVDRRTQAGAIIPVFTLADEVDHVYARDTHLAFSCGTDVYLFTAGAVSATLLQSGIAGIRGLHVESDGAVYAVCAGGNIVHVTADAATTVADLDLDLNDHTFYQGTASALRGAAGGEDEHLFLQQNPPGTSYLPQRVFTGATITHLERLVVELLPAVGTVLDGGTPALLDESLVIALDTVAGPVLARLQKTVKADLAYEGLGVSVVFDATSLGAAPA